nr:MAG: RNA-dependent RNA polymerase [Permutotetraviridae sp.]
MKHYINMSYSNAFRFFQSANSKSGSNFSPLAIFLATVVKKGDKVTDMELDSLVVECNSPDLKAQFLKGLVGIEEITREDVVSALEFINGKNTAEVKDRGPLVYVMPKMPPILPNQYVLGALEGVWRSLGEVVVNGNPICNSLSWSPTAPDRRAWTFMVQHSLGELLVPMMGKVNCGGTWEGLISVLEKSQRESDFVGDLLSYLPRVQERLPVRDEIRVKGEPWTLKDLFYYNMQKVSINKHARAGLPFELSEKCSDSNYALAVRDAATLYQYFIKDGKMAGDVITDCFDNRPYLVTARLANKFAVYDKDQLLHKTRPYFIFPFAIRLLGSYYYQNMKDRIGYWDEEKESALSQSMLGFTWFHGGAQGLYDKICSSAEGALNFLYYSDDFLIWVRVGNVVKLFSPDFSHYDGSLREAHVELNAQFDCYRVKRHGGNEADCELIRFLSRLSMVHFVAANRTDVFLKETGSSSGHWNTTGLNQTVSAVAACVMEDYWKEQKFDFLSFEKFADSVAPVVLEKVGLIIKPSTIKVRVERCDLDVGGVLSINFLGQDLGMLLSKGKKVIVPFPSISKVAQSYVFAPNENMDAHSIDIALARVAGICLSGGFYYEKFYECLRVDYNGSLAARRANKPPLPPLDVNNFVIPGELFHDASFEALSTHDWSLRFPDRDWFIQLYHKEGDLGAVSVVPALILGDKKGKMDRSAALASLKGGSLTTKYTGHSSAPQYAIKAQTAKEKSDKLWANSQSAVSKMLQPPQVAKPSLPRSKTPVAQPSTKAPQPQEEAPKIDAAFVRSAVFNIAPISSSPKKINELAQKLKIPVAAVKKAIAELLGVKRIELVGKMYVQAQSRPPTPVPKEVKAEVPKLLEHKNKMPNPNDYKLEIFKDEDSLDERFMELVDKGVASTAVARKVFGSSYLQAQKRWKSSGYVFNVDVNLWEAL